MNYFEVRKQLRQVFGLLICLLLISGAVFSQETETEKTKSTEKTEAANSAEKMDAATQEPQQEFQFSAAKTNRTAIGNTFSNRFGKNEVTRLNGLSGENFSARRFTDFAATDKERLEKFSFFRNGKTSDESERKTLGKSFSEAADETVETPKAAQSDDQKSLRFGGHAGFVVPIVGYGNDSYSRFYDDFTFGFPVGLTLKPKGPVAIDFEFIFLSAASPNNRRFVFVIHPGVIYGFKKKYAVGVRAAYEANNNDAYGFTPLVSRSFKINEKLNHFIEFDFPVRWNKRTVRVGNQNFNDRFLSGAFAVHYGVSF